MLKNKLKFFRKNSLISLSRNYDPYQDVLDGSLYLSMQKNPSFSKYLLSDKKHQFKGVTSSYLEDNLSSSKVDFLVQEASFMDPNSDKFLPYDAGMDYLMRGSKSKVVDSFLNKVGLDNLALSDLFLSSLLFVSNPHSKHYFLSKEGFLMVEKVTPRLNSYTQSKTVKPGPEFLYKDEKMIMTYLDYVR